MTNKLGINGGYVGYRRVPTTSAAIGVWSLMGAYLARLGSIWPGFTVLDVGPGAVNRAELTYQNYTYIDAANPVNADGVIDSVELWFANNATGVKVAVFSKSGSVFTPRDVETIGAVTAGSKQTFSGLSLTVVAGDYIGVYFSGGDIEWSSSGGSGVWYKSGDQTGAGAQTYTEAATGVISIYGTGVG